VHCVRVLTAVAVPVAPKKEKASTPANDVSWLRMAALVLLGVALGYVVKAWAPSVGSAPTVVSSGAADTPSAPSAPSVRVVSLAELAAHGASSSDNKDGQVWLAVLGEVFDVSSGGSYKQGGGYDFFTGRDGSAAFVTGNFTDAGLVADVTDLEASQVLEVFDWVDFYRKHATYKFVGLLHDVYYDANGAPTAKYRRMRALAAEGATLKQADEELRKLWPGCNMRSSPAEGRVFWCEDGSGGIKGRGWDGYPREFAQRQKSGEFAKRCVCAPKEKLDHPQLRVYINCNPESNTCTFPPHQEEI
jgi:predicted heme/steroid binding protein